MQLATAFPLTTEARQFLHQAAQAFQVSPARQGWYRLPERERGNTNIKLVDEHPGGYQRYQVSRVILRVGYFVQYKDMPEVVLRTWLKYRLCDQLQLTERQAQRVLAICGALDWEDVHDPPRAWDQLDLIGAALPDLQSEVRALWLAHVRELLPKEERQLRTFWYYDLPHPFTGWLQKHAFRKIGYQQPGGTYGGYGEYEPDWEGPSFNQTSQHRLYDVHLVTTFRDDDVLVPARAAGLDTFHGCWVHPLDLTPNTL